jgi:quercetin dioxygenase-like cupin family protein
MSIPHAKPGQIMSARPLGPALATTATQTLVRASDVEVIRLIAPAGKEIQQHKAKGEIVVQCLEGQVAFTALGKTQNLQAGEFLYLPAGEPHSITGVDNASILLTILLPKKDTEANGDLLEPASRAVGARVHMLGLLLSVVQAVVIVAAFGLLFAVAAGGVFWGVLGVVAAVAILGCLHYWVWGRRMSRHN